MSLNKFVEVELNGEKKILKFGFNSGADLEEKLGKGIMAIMSEEQIGFRLCRTLYWAGLKWKDQTLTVEKVGDMLEKEIDENGKDLMTLMEPVMKALQKSKLLGATTEEESEKN